MRGFDRDFGVSETSAGRFETSDGGEQLRCAEAPRRALLAVGVDDADDLGRAAAAIEPRVAQKPGPRLATNAPGETLRCDARSPAVEPAVSKPRRLRHVVFTSSDPAASSRFFTDGIGFQLSDEIPAFGASFLRCSTGHHDVLV